MAEGGNTRISAAVDRRIAWAAQTAEQYNNLRWDEGQRVVMEEEERARRYNNLRGTGTWVVEVQRVGRSGLVGVGYLMWRSRD